MEANERADGRKFRPFPSLELAVQEDISSKSVHLALDRIFDMCGCPTCGLNGIIDLKISVINPVMRDEFEGILGMSQNIRV